MNGEENTSQDIANWTKERMNLIKESRDQIHELYGKKQIPIQRGGGVGAAAGAAMASSQGLQEMEAGKRHAAHSMDGGDEGGEKQEGSAEHDNTKETITSDDVWRLFNLPLWKQKKEDITTTKHTQKLTSSETKKAAGAIHDVPENPNEIAQKIGAKSMAKQMAVQAELEPPVWNLKYAQPSAIKSTLDQVFEGFDMIPKAPKWIKGFEDLLLLEEYAAEFLGKIAGATFADQTFQDMVANAMQAKVTGLLASVLQHIMGNITEEMHVSGMPPSADVAALQKIMKQIAAGGVSVPSKTKHMAEKGLARAEGKVEAAKVKDAAAGRAMEGAGAAHGATVEGVVAEPVATTSGQATGAGAAAAGGEGGAAASAPAASAPAASAPAASTTPAAPAGSGVDGGTAISTIPAAPAAQIAAIPAGSGVDGGTAISTIPAAPARQATPKTSTEAAALMQHHPAVRQQAATNEARSNADAAASKATESAAHLETLNTQMRAASVEGATEAQQQVGREATGKLNDAQMKATKDAIDAHSAHTELMVHKTQGSENRLLDKADNAKDTATANTLKENVSKQGGSSDAAHKASVARAEQVGKVHDARGKQDRAADETSRVEARALPGSHAVRAVDQKQGVAAHEQAKDNVKTQSEALLSTPKPEVTVTPTEGEGGAAPPAAPPAVPSATATTDAAGAAPPATEPAAVAPSALETPAVKPDAATIAAKKTADQAAGRAAVSKARVDALKIKEKADVEAGLKDGASSQELAAADRALLGKTVSSDRPGAMTLNEAESAAATHAKAATDAQTVLQQHHDRQAQETGAVETPVETPAVPPPAAPPVLETPVETPAVLPPAAPPVLETPVETPAVLPPAAPPVLETPVETPAVPPPAVPTTTTTEGAGQPVTQTGEPAGAAAAPARPETEGDRAPAAAQIQPTTDTGALVSKDGQPAAAPARPETQTSLESKDGQPPAGPETQAQQRQPTTPAAKPAGRSTLSRVGSTLATGAAAVADTGALVGSVVTGQPVMVGSFSNALESSRAGAAAADSRAAEGRGTRPPVTVKAPTSFEARSAGAAAAGAAARPPVTRKAATAPPKAVTRRQPAARRTVDPVAVDKAAAQLKTAAAHKGKTGKELKAAKVELAHQKKQHTGVRGWKNEKMRATHDSLIKQKQAAVARKQDASVLDAAAAATQAAIENEKDPKKKEELQRTLTGQMASLNVLQSAQKGHEKNVSQLAASIQKSQQQGGGKRRKRRKRTARRKARQSAKRKRKDKQKCRQSAKQNADKRRTLKKKTTGKNSSKHRQAKKYVPFSDSDCIF